jgi:hypothetical protein
MEELREHGLESLRLARGRAETPVLFHDHSYRKEGQRDEATHHGGSEKADVSQQLP